MTAPRVQRPGDFAVVNTGPNFAARAIRWATHSTVNHAFIYIGDGNIVEAQPGGAVISPVHRYAAHRPVWSTGVIHLTTAQRWAIRAAALRDVGTPYGWLDIACIGLAQTRLGGLVDSNDPIARRVSSLHTDICSQLVDRDYEYAGVHLFNDGRLPGLVSPGDLLTLLERTPAHA